jgi:hypothetical protein
MKDLNVKDTQKLDPKPTPPPRKEQTRETFTVESLAAEFPNMIFPPADGMAFTMPTSNPVTRSVRLKKPSGRKK